MQTKLTLRLDDKIIQRAKEQSTKQGKSLSKLVEDYFQLYHSDPSEKNEKLPPVVRSLKGILKNTDIDRADYRKHLEEKYL